MYDLHMYVSNTNSFSRILGKIIYYHLKELPWKFK